MEHSPEVDRLFTLFGGLSSKERVAVAVTTLTVEAHRLSKDNADLRAYMIQECGLGWERPQNGGLAASLAFIRYIKDDRFNKPVRAQMEA